MLFPLFLVAAGLARTECPASATHLHAKVTSTLKAHRDPATFDRQRQEVEEEMACLAEVVTPALARDYHLLEAVQRARESNQAGAILSLRALLSLDPAYRLPADIAPEGGQLRRLFETARTAGAGAAREFLQPVDGVLLLDGRSLLSRPGDRAAIFQWAAGAGQVCWSGYLDPSQSMPSGIVAAALDPDGLQRCLAERRIYAEDSSEPEPAMAAPEPPPIAGAEESDGDFFAELARLVTPGAEAEATTPSEDAAPRAARDETVEAREEEAKVEDIQEEAGVSDVGEVEERPRTRPGIEGRRVAPLARLGGAVARVGDPETRGKTEVDEPPGFTTGGLEVLLGVEVLISPRLGLQAGLGGLGTWGPGLVGDEQPDPSTMAEVTLKPSSLLAADARIQAAVHLGPVGLSLGPTFRLLAMNAAVWESDEFGGGSFSAWQGSALGIGLAADATVALGRHPFLYASGWATRDNRLWLDATLGFGWKL